MRALTAGACAALLTGALFIAGCGGGDDALTKSEFLKQGNAICKKGNQDIDKAANQTFEKGQEPTKAQVTKFAEDTLIPSVDEQISGLRDLNPPSADEDKVNAILDEAESSLDKVKADPSLFASNQDPFKKANQMANAYGLTECGG